MPRLRPTICTTLACLAGAGLLAAGVSGAEPLSDQLFVSAPVESDAYVDPEVAYNASADQYLTVWQRTANRDGEILGRLSTGDGTPVGAEFRISDMGPEGDAGYGYVAASPTVVYNSRANEYLVVWRGDDNIGSLVDGEFEIFVQRLAADGTEIGGDTRISDMGPDGNPKYDAFTPAVAYNSRSNEYLVAWHGDDDTAPQVDGEFEIFVQRLAADGTEIGGDTRISDMGPDGNPKYDAFRPALAYNATANEYLLSWRGTDDVAERGDPGQAGIYVERLAADATEIDGERILSNVVHATHPDVAYNGSDNEYLVVWVHEESPAMNWINARRLAADGTNAGRQIEFQELPTGSGNEDAFRPALAYSTAAGEYLMSWRGHDASQLADFKFEIYAQRLSRSAETIGSSLRVSRTQRVRHPDVAYNARANEYFVAWQGRDDSLDSKIYARRIAGGDEISSAPPDAPSSSPVPTLTSSQLKINQRIGQAAIRRANAIQDWLDAGLINDDLRGGVLTGRELDAGVSYSSGAPRTTAPAASPRPLVIPLATTKPRATFEFTAKQLQINQRVYSAAVRRANALTARIDGQLTGGDIIDGQLTADRLLADLKLGALTPAAAVTPASTTKVPPAETKKVDFTPSLRQSQINQRIAQAAVRRTNALRALLGSGLTGENFAAGSISAADFAR